MTKFIRNRNPKQKEVSATVQVEPQDYQGRSSESTYRIVNWKLPGVQPKWFDTSKRHREGLQVTYISVRWAAKNGCASWLDWGSGNDILSPNSVGANCLTCNRLWTLSASFIPTPVLCCTRQSRGLNFNRHKMKLSNGVWRGWYVLRDIHSFLDQS